MGRRARNKQGEPEPLVKPERELKTSGFKRSGGKRKPIVPVSKPEIKSKGKGKAREDAVEDEYTEDPTLRAARATLFDEADLEPAPEAMKGEALDLEALMAEDEDDEEEADRSDGEGLDALDEGPDPAGLLVDEYDVVDDDADETREEGAAVSALDEDVPDELAIVEGDDLELHMDEGDGDLDGPGSTSRAPGIQLVKQRMHSAVRVLVDWKTLGGKDGRSRSEVMEQFVADVAEYYGYNVFLAEKLLQLFPLREALAFLDASDTPRPITIRTNTLRTRRRELAQTLINRGVSLEPIPGKWTKVGLQVFESSVPIGATPEYLAGQYILQAASSFLPVMALAPQPGERVLDMSAAPGGKTTYISALLQNTGTVFANDSNKQRIKALSANVARMGCRNVVICNHDGRAFPKVLGGFNRVLLDAPCSGTGVISKDPSVKINKTARDFTLLAHLQKELILAAIDSCATGGHVVYSTCSVTVEENEAVVAYALRKRPHVKLVDTGLGFGTPGFKSFGGHVYGEALALTRRFYPHKENMDGFYTSKLYVGKRSKVTPAEAEDEPVDVLETFDVADDGTVTITEAPKESLAFDDPADVEIIQASRRSHLKRKGHDPRSLKPRPAKIPKTAA